MYSNTDGHFSGVFRKNVLKPLESAYQYEGHSTKDFYKEILVQNYDQVHCSVRKWFFDETDFYIEQTSQCYLGLEQK